MIKGPVSFHGSRKGLVYDFGWILNIHSVLYSNSVSSGELNSFFKKSYCPDTGSIFANKRECG